MVYRKGISAVVFKRKGKNVRFLLLHRFQNWTGWEFLKGGLKNRENEESCLKRELREETGVRKYLSAEIDYRYGYRWNKEYVKDNNTYHGASFTLFVVEDKDKTDRVRIDKCEHSGYRWVDGRKAVKMLTYANQRKALRFVLSHYF